MIKAWCFQFHALSNPEHLSLYLEFLVTRSNFDTDNCQNLKCSGIYPRLKRMNYLSRRERTWSVGPNVRFMAASMIIRLRECLNECMMILEEVEVGVKKV